jgi:hypothetical protein
MEEAFTDQPAGSAYWHASSAAALALLLQPDLALRAAVARARGAANALAPTPCCLMNADMCSCECICVCPVPTPSAPKEHCMQPQIVCHHRETAIFYVVHAGTQVREVLIAMMLACIMVCPPTVQCTHDDVVVHMTQKQSANSSCELVGQMLASALPPLRRRTRQKHKSHEHVGSTCG